MATIVGVDVSDFQENFDWKQAAKEGVQFGVAKATEGTAYVAKTLLYHWSAMKEAGLARGLYHFSRWDRETDPAAEARHFLCSLPPLAYGDVLALDIEDSPLQIQPPADLSWWALSWLAAVEIATHRNPLVYSDYAFAKAHLGDARLGQYGLWVAAYGPSCPERFGPWQTVAAWQHTAAAQHAGTAVDESIFYGSVEQLRAYGTPARAPLDGPKPGAGAQRGGPRFLITRAMMARTAPDLGAVHWPVQMVEKNAVLEGTGRQTAHWAEVIAGGHPVWVWLQNTTPA